MLKSGCTQADSSEYNLFKPITKIIEIPKTNGSVKGGCTHTVRHSKNQAMIDQCKARTMETCCGWIEVRYVMGKFAKWHPSTDKLEGTDVYGIPFMDENNWSIKFSHMAFNQFLFTTGDKTKWLIANKDQVTGWYENQPR